MALIKYYRQDADNKWIVTPIEYDGLAYQWIAENIKQGVNFSVFDGDACEENEISRTDKMRTATDVSVMEIPGAVIAPYLVQIIIAVVVAVAVTLLTPSPDALGNLNRTQSSPNNELSDRTNKYRPNQRIVDIIGKVKSIPDIIQKEFARFVDGVEERIGAYCVCRNQCDIDELRDGDNLISEINGASAGVYYPFKSPNNSAPDVQIGDVIDEKVVGVYQSTNALGQTLEAPEVKTIQVGAGATVARSEPAGLVGWIIDPTIDFSTEYVIGDFVEFVDLWAEIGPGGGFADYVQLGQGGAMQVVGNAFGMLEVALDNNPEWFDLPAQYTDYDVAFSIPASIVQSGSVIYKPVSPKIESPDFFVGDTYKISTQKVDRLLFNVYAQSGLYKRSSGDKEQVSVDFVVAYYLLNDSLERIGALQNVAGNITGTTDDQFGVTVDINIGSPYYIEWYVYRTSYTDVDYQGTVVDAIKLKDVFGLYDIDRTDFGNITMIQTKRKALQQVTAITNPEVNCIATEMVYKYLGGGAFDTVLTKNTQAFQSLISKALDNKIGRMQASDLDLDLLLQTQTDIETYFSDVEAGQCSYSLDSTNTTAQQALTLISNSVNSILWREGRVLKSWFERPQTVPEMIFTHRSKQPNSETWNRLFKQEKDGVSFKYTDDTTYKQEVLTYPTDAINTKSFEISGIKGLKAATWRMMREYNKLVWQRISVDFTATAEGRFVKPSKLISVVKGSRVGSTDGYVMAVDLLFVELSQEVTFTPGDEHSIIFKKRDGSTQSITCLETANKRIVELEFAPIEALYTGNDELKTEFSFGNDARLQGQLMLPQTIDSSDKQYTRITAVNYSADYYKDDTEQVIYSGFDSGFDSGFF